MGSKSAVGKRMLAMASALLLVLGCLSFSIPAPVAEPEDELLPYLDTSRSFEERAADLVSRLTLEEKVHLLGNRTTSAIPRLGVKTYDFWRECLHGVARLGEATSFPYSLAMASSWDPELIQQITTATSDEARGYDNKSGTGLSYFSPTINMARDPRWGRNHETYGEDPYLTGQIGTGFVAGLQGDDDRYVKISATLKHYAANNSEYNRHSGNSEMDERDLREYYTRAFKNVLANVDAGSAMSAYNRVNGDPASANVHLLDTLLRKTFGFNGFVVSDCGAIQDITENHKWAPEELGRVVTKEESVNYSLLAGCDMDCGSIYPSYAASAVKAGILKESTIDLALVRIFLTRFKTGEFYPAEMVPYKAEEYSFENQVEAADHKQLAEDAADDGIVLLQNKNNVLPLSADQKNIVMIGDIAEKVELGGYSGSPSVENTTSPIQGMQNQGATITYIKNGTATAKGSYICNLRNVTIHKKDGSKVVLKPNQAQNLLGCQLESTNIGYVSPGATLMYPNVNIDGIDSVSFEVAGNPDALPGKISMTMDSPSGMQFASVLTEQTGGWQTYKALTSTVGDTGGYTQKDLYLTFTLEQQTVSFSDADTQKIKDADAVVVCLQGNTSGEGTDRTTITASSYQTGLASTVGKLNPNTIIYLQTVGPIEVTAFADDVASILWTCYNGQAQGNAMARVIYGKSIPTAKLTQTWYESNANLETIDDYDVRGGEGYNGWTYQYYNGPVSYPFGFGLSYTTYAYSNLKIDKTTVTPDDTLTVTVDVTNTGDVDGREIVQLYVAVPNNDGVDRPFKQLKAFDKVAIKAGETQTVTLKLDMSECYFWDDEAGHNVYDQGEYTLFVGPSSVETDCLSTKVTVDGELTPEMRVLTAQPDGVILNAANTAKVIKTDLVIAMNDDSFLDNSKATIRYSVADEKVATVDANGTVYAVGGGVTTVTATVTVNGKTMTDSYPVVVKVELESIAVDGEPLDTFRSDVTEYYVPVSGDKAPAVTVPGVPEKHVTVVDATSLPGTATVTINMDGVTSVYTIHFTKRSSDYVVARYTGFDGEYSVENKTTFLVNWTTPDQGSSIDFTTHDIEDLRLRMVLNLKQTGNTVIPDEQAYRSGFIWLRSADKNGENSVGRYLAKEGLKSGANYLDIPLTAFTDKRGNMDWTTVGRMNIYIDSLNNYEGPFEIAISDTMIVDISLNPEREELWSMIDDSIVEANYTEASLVPYREAKNGVLDLIFSADDVTADQVAKAKAAYDKAKAGLKEDIYLIGTFSKSSGEYTVLDNGNGYILYNDWKNGDNVPFDLSGDRTNMRLQMTVQFVSNVPEVEAENCWTNLCIKLRSADETGKDGDPNNSEHNYGWDIKPSAVANKETVQVSIDLSSEATNKRGIIDWADIRRLIILGELSSEARNNSAKNDNYKMLVSDVKIVDLTNVKSQQAELKELMDKEVDLTGATAEQKSAYEAAKANAVDFADTELCSTTDVYYAYKALKDAVDAIEGAEITAPYGDVDGNGEVAAADALLALQIATNKVTAGEDTLAAANVDDAPGVSANDALMILQYATKKIAKFPIEA